MNLIESVLSIAATFVPLLLIVMIAIAVIVFVDRTLRKRSLDNPDARVRNQLIILSLAFAAGLAAIIAMPVSNETRGQLLSLIGILLSAAIALSSTTFIGNMMAGIMLKVVKNARPGDFIVVDNLTGRVTEMALLHTEIQTEFRDLVTVPNLYIVTRPMQVVRTSGTIIQAEVSLGYDLSHDEVAKILCAAAEQAGLKDPFTHVRELGDFSVLYRVAGLLEDVKSLISARSRLRECMLDALHRADIEIVSPNFMNTRAVPEGRSFIARPARKKSATAETTAEDMAFDKADEAASVEEIRKAIESVDVELKAIAEGEGGVDEPALTRLEKKKARLVERLKQAEEKRVEAELKDA